MAGHQMVCELVNDLFEEAALAIGGLVALYPVNDEFVQRLFASLSVIHQKAMQRIEEPDSKGSAGSARARGEPHPDIAEFLAKIGRA